MAIQPGETWRWLLIDTSGQPGQVGLGLGQHLSAFASLDPRRNHSRDLAPGIRDLCHKEGWKPRDIQGILVNQGPGSYTGLRVGLISAKALAYATGCQLIGISTPALLAHQVPADLDRVHILLEAQQGRVYHQLFVRQRDKEKMLAQSPLKVVPFSEWNTQAAGEVVAMGSGLIKNRDALKESVHVLPEVLWKPQLTSILALGQEKALAGEGGDWWPMEPLYLRPSSAEQQWDQREGLGQGPGGEK